MLAQTMDHPADASPALWHTQVNFMDIRKHTALRLFGLTLLVSLALATMIGGVMVIWT